MSRVRAPDKEFSNIIFAGLKYSMSIMFS
ncbi:hypothetical protein JL09_g5976 [Pichia kudriavzevii]|uniref:Uncharacterized protein n=1 Tax=Pichia kudriavzevii TaxID=4909 RepID=A0A099NQS2_PICKU|nr:hypothetical protein JL09_g5976 [Pichia kudriavzevii]